MAALLSIISGKEMENQLQISPLHPAVLSSTKAGRGSCQQLPWSSRLREEGLEGRKKGQIESK